MDETVVFVVFYTYSRYFSLMHSGCLRNIGSRGLDGWTEEKTAKADAATESIKSQRDALEKMCPNCIQLRQ